MSLRAGLQLRRITPLWVLAVLLSSCERTAPCDGPGTCAAGWVCQQGACQRPTERDAGAVVIDSGQSLPDAARDTGVAPPRDSGADDLGFMSRDVSARPDTGSLPQDAGGGPATGLGAPCVVPDFNAGEVDSCSAEDPNFYCVARLDGQGGYCTKACAVEQVNDGHHAGIDIGWHPHPDPCDGLGCCLPVDPGVDAGPFEPIDRLCRFGSDCG